MVVNNLRVTLDLVDILDRGSSFDLYLSTNPRIPYLSVKTTPAMVSSRLILSRQAIRVKHLRSIMR